MPRPVMLGIVGDSGSGKTTITRGLVRVLGEDQVTHFCADDYHRYDRRQRAERNITPLHPECNHLDIRAQHLRHPRTKEPILNPVYQHANGTFAPPDYLAPGRFLVTEGLLAFSNRELCEMFDVRVYLDPPEELRRHWKVQRDCSRRGYTTDEVLAELDRREPDSETFIRSRATCASSASASSRSAPRSTAPTRLRSSSCSSSTTSSAHARRWRGATARHATWTCRRSPRWSRARRPSRSRIPG